MELSTKNYKQTLPAVLLKKAEKCNVRECDEVEKGHFVAYVDENSDSFDVSLTLDHAGKVTAHICDCKVKSPFCQHKAALFLSLSKGKKGTTGKIKGKKVSRLETLMQDIDPEKLKIWVADLLAKNKDIELAFIHQFSRQEEQYTPALLKQQTLDAVKAVIKNKRKLEASDVKKMVDLWTTIHDPFINWFRAQVADKNALNTFHALMEACQEVQRKVVTSSIRINKYIEQLLLTTAEHTHQLKTEEAFNFVTNYFTEALFGDHVIRMHYLSFLVNLVNISEPERKHRLSMQMIKQYSQKNLHTFYNGEKYTEGIFNLATDNDLFTLHYKVFKPIQFNNDYNEELITLLMEDGRLELAEKYCQEQIKINSREEYNERYLEFLKEIYTLQQDNQKLSQVLKVLFPLAYNFDDFLFIYAQIENEEEKKKWRTKMLGRARQMTNSDAHVNVIAFPFRLMEYEQNFKKMVDYVDAHTPYSIILQYADKMMLVHKQGFLDALARKNDPYSYVDSSDEEHQFPQLADILLKYASKTEINMVFRKYEKSGWYRNNRFITFMKKRLS
jgi:hypothetical protein